MRAACSMRPGAGAPSTTTGATSTTGQPMRSRGSSSDARDRRRIRAGSTESFVFLLDMNKLFEDFVTQSPSRCPGTDWGAVSAQRRDRSIVENEDYTPTVRRGHPRHPAG